MSLYKFVLFIHVVSAIGLFVGLAVEGFVSIRIGGAADTGQMRFFTRAFDRLRWIFIPSFAGILFGGLYLGYRYGGGTFWIPAALIATLAIMIIGGIMTGRPMGRLKKATVNADVAFDSLSTQAKSRQVALSYGLRVGLALGIVFLMTAKPDLWRSTFALVVGCIAGLAIASGMRKIWTRTTLACGPWHNSIQRTPDAPAH